MIFERISRAFSKKRGREAAAQFALFAMFLQALIPFSAAVSLPGADAAARQGQDLPGFYLVICTAQGAKTLGQTAEQPLDGGQSSVMPWDCPVCQVQTGVQGPLPTKPQVAFTPHTLPRECAAPVVSDRVAGLWTSAPGLARAPPRA